jgi:hypothetical protein
MPGLWLPPQVEAKYAEARKADRAMVVSRAQIRDICVSFDAELKRIDPKLMMVWYDEGPDLPSGAVGGRYHLIRDNEGAPPSIIPICGPDGSFIEPNSGLFEWLRKGDMWNAQARRDRDAQMDRARQAAERAREREREDVQEEFKDRYNAAFRTSVSMTPDARWTQTARAKRAAHPGFRRAA